MADPAVCFFSSLILYRSISHAAGRNRLYMACLPADEDRDHRRVSPFGSSIAFDIESG